MKSFSTQQWHIRVGSGAVLVMLPGPVIPFQGCRSYQRVSAELEPGASFVWADVWFAGRYARGNQSEQFRFDRLVQDLEVYRSGERVYRDRFAWHGPWEEEAARWHFGKHMACGSVLIAGSLSEAALAGLAGDGATLRTATGQDTVLRWCGSAEDVVGAVVNAGLRAGAALASTSTDGAAKWLASDMLAPCHWFT